MGTPTLVLAGPGTGKTTTLVGRYLHLLNENVNPSGIICTTFNAKAANELKDRISEKTDLNLKPLPIGTFHSIALKILRSIGTNVGIQSNFEIWAKDWERRSQVSKIQKQLAEKDTYKDVDTIDTSPQKALEFIDAVREKLIDP